MENIKQIKKNKMFIYQSLFICLKKWIFFDIYVVNFFEYYFQYILEGYSNFILN